MDRLRARGLYEELKDEYNRLIYEYNEICNNLRERIPVNYYVKSNPDIEKLKSLVERLEQTYNRINELKEQINEIARQYGFKEVK